MSQGSISPFAIGHPSARDEPPVSPAKRSIGGHDWMDPQAVESLAQSLNSRGDYKRHVEDEAIFNVVFATGHQWRRFDRVLRRMVRDPNLESWDTRITYNMLYPLMESRIARLIRVGGGWGGFPETSDNEDIQVSRLVKQVLRYYWSGEGLDMEAKLTRAWGLTMLQKVCFLHPFWDPNKGETITTTPEDLMQGASPDSTPPGELGAPRSDTTGDAEPVEAEQAFSQFAEMFGEEAAREGQHTTQTGDVELDVVPLFEMLVWPFDIDHWSQGVIWRRRRKRLRTELELRYPKLDWDRISSSGQGRSTRGVNDLEDYQRRLARSWSFIDTGGQDADENVAMSDFIDVDELYLKAGVDRRFPEGAQAIVVAGITVEESLGPLSNPSKVIPFFAIQEKPIEGNLYGTSTGDQLRGGQREINLSASQMANYRNRMASPTLMIPAGSVTDGQFSNRPGAIVGTNADQQAGPYYLQRPPMPSDYERSIEVANRFMHDMSGVSAVDLGRTGEANVRSGVAIKQLKEQSDLRLLGIGKSTDRAVEAAGTIILGLLQERVVDDRLVSMVGENNRSEVITFNRYSLQPQGFGQPGRKTVLVRTASFAKIPNTPAEFIAVVEGLTTLGYMDPMKDRAMVLKGAGLGETQSFWDKDRIDEDAEMAAIELWRNGQSAPPPRQTSDFEVRLRILSGWAKSDEYALVISKNPQLAPEIAERIQAYKQGTLDNVVEAEYLAQTARIRMWQKYTARFVEAELAAGTDPQEAIEKAQLFFPPPIAATAGLSSPEGVSGGREGPPEVSDGRGRAGSPQSGAGLPKKARSAGPATPGGQTGRPRPPSGTARGR